MYILIISGGYPTEDNVGLGIFEFEQALALRDSGHKVVFAAVDLRSIRRWRRWGIERIEKEGIEVWAINIPCGNIPKDVLYSAGVLGLKILYKKIYSQHGAPDIVHAHFGRVGFISLKALSGNKLPIVVTEHSSLVLTKKLKKFEIRCLKSCVEESNAFICVSSALKKSVLQLTDSNKNIHIVPNMVSPLFKYKSKQLNKEDFLFLSVGNLIESKRFDITIDAFSKAFQGNEAVRLYISGNGPQRGYLQQKINELKMNNQIFLLGQLTRQEVVEKMHECDVFVLASDFETFGVVYIEALACGKPVIGTRNGGAEDIINETNGVLIDIDNVAQLSDTMKKMYTNEIKFDSNKIAEYTHKRYSSENVAAQLISIYKGVFQ